MIVLTPLFVMRPPRDHKEKVQTLSWGQLNFRPQGGRRRQEGGQRGAGERKNAGNLYCFRFRVEMSTLLNREIASLLAGLFFERGVEEQDLNCNFFFAYGIFSLFRRYACSSFPLNELVPWLTAV